MVCGFYKLSVIRVLSSVPVLLTVPVLSNYKIVRKTCLDIRRKEFSSIWWGYLYLIPDQEILWNWTYFYLYFIPFYSSDSYFTDLPSLRFHNITYCAASEKPWARCRVGTRDTMHAVYSFIIVWVVLHDKVNEKSQI